jgi:hypothetical protein
MIDIRYVINIEPFPFTSDRFISMDNNSATSRYFYESFKLSNDIFDPTQNAEIVIAQGDYFGGITFFADVNDNDFVTINEVINGNSSTLFRGYIESRELVHAGESTKITIQVANILKQLNMCKTVNTVNEQSTFSINSTATNEGTFKTFLNLIFQDTLVTQSYSGEVANVAILKGQNEADSVALSPSTNVYAFYDSTMSRWQTLTRVIYPYQRICYQDINSIINIAPLTVVPSSWAFSFGNKINPISKNVIPYTSFGYVSNGGKTSNRQISTLLTMPVNTTELTYTPSDYANVVSLVTPLQKYFPRQVQLLQSGAAVYTNYTQEDVLGDTGKNSNVLANIASLSTGNSLSQSVGVVLSTAYQAQTPLSNNPNSDTLDPTRILYNYAIRDMAQNLVDETIITVSCFRDMSADTIPLGKMVDINAPVGIGNLASYYCRGFELSHESKKGTVLTLRLCKPYTYTGYWVTGELVSSLGSFL